MNITIETCEFGRNDGGVSSAGGWQTLTAPQGKYNFINKIVDGITVTINAVNIKFKSPAFIASIQVCDSMYISITMISTLCTYNGKSISNNLIRLF